MRRHGLLVGLVVLLAAPTVGAQPDNASNSESKAAKAKKKRLEENRRRRARERERRVRERILSSKQLEDAVAPWGENITECYRKFGMVHRKASGTLRLELLIAPTGRIRHLYVLAPGVRGKKLKACVKKVADQIRFPTRKGFTKATIPFRFLQSTAGRGPLKTCWSRSSCASKKKATRKSKATRKKTPEKNTKNKKRSTQ